MGFFGEWEITFHPSPIYKLYALVLRPVPTGSRAPLQGDDESLYLCNQHQKATHPTPDLAFAVGGAHDRSP